MVSTGLLVAASPERSVPLASASTSASTPAIVPDVSQQILQKLVGLSDQITAIDRRVQHNEQAIAQHTSTAQISTSGTPTVPTGPSVAAVRPSNEPSSNPNSLVPSIDYLKSNQAIQHQVDGPVQELQRLNENRVHRSPLKDMFHGHKTMSS